MTVIAGIDLSLTSTGLARLTTDGTKWVAETTVRESKPVGDTLADRHRRIRDITADVIAWALPCDLAVIEAPIRSLHQAGTWERAWLWGAVVSRLIDRETRLVSIPPAIRAKFAASHGGADKAAVALATAKMWPDWCPGAAKGVNDQADALALASIGVVLNGHVPPFPMPIYRDTALAKVPRPERNAAA